MTSEIRHSHALLATLIAFAACTHTPPREQASDAVPYTAQVVNPDLIGGLGIPNSNVAVLWGTDGSILRSTNSHDWEYASTPIATDLTRVASDASGNTLLAVGKQGMALRSSDAGLTWHTVLSVGADIDLKAVVHHDMSSTWFIAGTKGALLRSADGGTTWEQVALPLADAIETLFVDRATNALLLGAEGGIIGRSLDAGNSWELTSIAMPAPATPITRFFRDESLLIGLSALGRFLTSGDDGATWTLVQSPTKAYFTDIARDPRHGSLVMIGHDATILRTTDAAGVPWSADVLLPDAPRNYLSAIRFDALSQSLMVVGHGGLLARSVDGGASWQRLEPPAPGNFEGLMQSGATLIAFGSGGSIVTADTERHWRVSRSALSLYLRDIALTPNADALVATGQLGEIIRSRNGVDWHRIAIRYPDEHTPPDLRALTASTDGDALIAAGPPGAILRSSAAGDRWDIVLWHALDAGRAYPWIVKDGARNTAVTIDARGAMQISTDNGVQWREVDARTAGELWHGAVLERTGVMIAAGKGGAAALSRNGGTSWSDVHTGTEQDLFGSYADEATQRLFLMGQAGALLRSTDGGSTWHSMASGTASPLRRMIRDPRSEALICIGGDGAILRSTDGEAWQRIDGGVDAELRKAIADPHDESLLIAGRNGVVLRSIDGGARWQRLPTHTQRHFTSIAALANGDLIAVGERIVYLTRSPR